MRSGACAVQGRLEFFSGMVGDLRPAERTQGLKKVRPFVMINGVERPAQVILTMKMGEINHPGSSSYRPS